MADTAPQTGSPVPVAVPAGPDRVITRERVAVFVLLAVLALIPPLMTWLGETFYIRLFTRILVFAIAAVGLDLILGYGGMVSFGHAAFLGLGAYAVGIPFHHSQVGGTFLGLPGTLDALVTWPLGIAASAMFALIVGAISLRTSGVYFIMITLAFAQMLYFLMVGLRQYGGDDGISLWSPSELAGLDLGDRTVFYYLCYGLLVAVLFLSWRLVHSRFGRVLRGAKENERRMRALGFPVYRYRLVAFTLSGAICGLAGALLANATLFVGPAYMTWTRSGDLIVMVVLGGIGTLAGPVVGSAGLLLLEEFVPEAMNMVRHGLGEHWRIVLGPVLLLIVLFARQGIWGWIRGAGR